MAFKDKTLDELKPKHKDDLRKAIHAYMTLLDDAGGSYDAADAAAAAARTAGKQE